jgi:hypothetical protein
LKIRETVLNHTQGIEGSEFKHGPNTILGFNTIFGTRDLEYFIKYNKNLISYAMERSHKEKLTEKETAKLISDLSSYIFEPVKPFNIMPKAQKIFDEAVAKFDFIEDLNTNYPLIFLTGPEPRDINLTISFRLSNNPRFFFGGFLFRIMFSDSISRFLNRTHFS